MSNWERLANEKKIGSAEAAELAGVHRHTIRNWILFGVRGVKLDGFVAGEQVRTSAEAIARFLRACEQAAKPPQIASPAAQRRRQAYVEKELRKEGLLT